MLFRSIIVLAISFCSLNTFSEGKHKHDFPEEIMKFHNVMAPLWHMEKGDLRTKSTCDSIEEMKMLSGNIKNSKALKEGLNELSKSCSDNTMFNKAFSSLHDAYHKVSDEAKKHKN